MEFMESTYHYKGLWGIPSSCGLKVVRNGERHIFILTELYDRNPGTSVTNFAPQLATLLLRERELQPGQAVFIEHTPDIKSKLEIYRESFDIISFDWDGTQFTNPRWQRVARGEVERLIQGGAS